jgi:predicted metal-dependent enzyme (double-stranded beta helix superfamily)
MTVALDAPVRGLFEHVAVATAGASPDLDAIAGALGDLARDTDYLGPWVDRLGARSGSLPIHQPDDGPRLMLVHRTEGQMSAVHDHGTWVGIAAITGLETHRRWRVRHVDGSAPAIELAEQLGLGAGQVATMLPPDDVHDHGHLIGHGSPAYTLVLLGDRQTRHARNEWDLATGRHRVLVPGDGGRWVSTEPFPG